MEPEHSDHPFASSGAQPGPLGVGRLASGLTLAGGRISIANLADRTPYGELYRAVDRQTNDPLSVHVLNPGVAGDARAVEALRAEIATASSIDHKNLTRVLSLGVEGDLVFVVSEHTDGQSLRSLLERKSAAGAAPFSMKAAYNTIAHVCNALAHVHHVTFHGALSSRNVHVNKAGRVKICELGVARVLVGAVRGSLDAADAAALAPEVTAGGSVDRRADVFATGAILFELLTGRPPVDGVVRPGSLVQGLPAELDEVVARCLSPDPAGRFSDTAQLKAVLAAVLEGKAGVSGTMPAARLSGSQPIAAAGRPSAAQPVAAAPRPSAAGAAVPGRPSGAHAAAVAGPQASARMPIPTPIPALGIGPKAGGISLDEAEEKWLVQKGKLDFGPFSMLQIKDQIAHDNIHPEHYIVDNENGERVRAEDHPLLHDMVLRAAQRRDDLRRAQAEVVVAKQDKRRGITLYLVIGAGAIALGVGIYFLVTALGHAKKDGGTGDIAALDKAKLNVSIEFKPQPPRRKSGGGGGGRSGGGGGGGAAGGYDDSLDLGNAAEGDEDSERLDNSQLTSVIQRHGNSLAGCLQKTGERRASIDFIVAGATGRVTGVRVNGQTGTDLANCIRGKMAAMQFPTFNGPRTKGTFDMSF